MFQKTELAEGGGQVRLVELRRLGFPTVTRQVKGRVAKAPWARLGMYRSSKPDFYNSGNRHRVLGVQSSLFAGGKRLKLQT